MTNLKPVINFESQQSKYFFDKILKGDKEALRCAVEDFSNGEEIRVEMANSTTRLNIMELFCSAERNDIMHEAIPMLNKIVSKEDFRKSAHANLVDVLIVEPIDTDGMLLAYSLNGINEVDAFNKLRYASVDSFLDSIKWHTRDGLEAAGLEKLLSKLFLNDDACVSAIKSDSHREDIMDALQEWRSAIIPRIFSKAKHPILVKWIIDHSHLTKDARLWAENSWHQVRYGEIEKFKKVLQCIAHLDEVKRSIFWDVIQKQCDDQERDLIDEAVYINSSDMKSTRDFFQFKEAFVEIKGPSEKIQEEQAGKIIETIYTEYLPKRPVARDKKSLDFLIGLAKRLPLRMINEAAAHYLESYADSDHERKEAFFLNLMNEMSGNVFKKAMPKAL